MMWPAIWVFGRITSALKLTLSSSNDNPYIDRLSELVGQLIKLSGYKIIKQEFVLRNC